MAARVVAQEGYSAMKAGKPLVITRPYECLNGVHDTLRADTIDSGCGAPLPRDDVVPAMQEQIFVRAQAAHPQEA